MENSQLKPEKADKEGEIKKKQVRRNKQHRVNVVDINLYQ